MSEQESLPYGGRNDPNSGYSGSPASEARARSEDRSGTTRHRQAQVERLIRAHGTIGRTWREVADTLNLHHGQASGALSAMHKAGRLARLDVRRMRCHVYVVPEFVNGRTTGAQGNTSATWLMAQMAELLERWDHPCNHGMYYVGGCLSCDTRIVLNRYANHS